MSNLVLRIDVLAGTHVERAIIEMIDKAQDLNINLEANFNGVNLFITPRSSIPQTLSDYEKEQNRQAILKHHE